MVKVARARSAGHPTLEYLVADATAWPLPPGRFDCAASIAAAHHLPLAPLLARMRDALAPGAAVRRHLLWRYSIVWRRPA